MTTVSKHYFKPVTPSREASCEKCDNGIAHPLHVAVPRAWTLALHEVVRVRGLAVFRPVRLSKEVRGDARQGNVVRALTKAGMVRCTRQGTGCYDPALYVCTEWGHVYLDWQRTQPWGPVAPREAHGGVQPTGSLPGQLSPVPAEGGPRVQRGGGLCDAPACARISPIGVARRRPR